MLLSLGPATGATKSEAIIIRGFHEIERRIERIET
jgi:hypothetical protein